MLMCVIGILLLTLITWIPSNLSPSNGRCLSSLVWWTAHYAQTGVAITVTLIATFIICTVVITVNLLRRSKLDRDERLQASIVVYYLIVNSLILVRNLSVDCPAWLIYSSLLFCRFTRKYSWAIRPFMHQNWPKLP